MAAGVLRPLRVNDNEALTNSHNWREGRGTKMDTKMWKQRCGVKEVVVEPWKAKNVEWRLPGETSEPGS